MSAASDLIDRLEKETGVRIDAHDAHDGDNIAMSGLLGAMSRELGQSPGLGERDDVAAGMLLHHKMSPAGKREKESKDARAALLSASLGLG